MSTSNDTTHLRKCTKCSIEHPETTEFFYVDRGRFTSACKFCIRANVARYRKENPEKARAAVANAEAKKPDHYHGLERTWKENNKDHLNEWFREWRRKNPEIAKKHTKNWRDKNPASKKQSWQRRRAIKMSALGSHTQDDVRQIYEEHDHRCAYCGITIFWEIPFDIHVDHFLALFRGGSDGPDNLRCACADCNLSKGGRLYEDWVKARGW